MPVITAPSVAVDIDVTQAGDIVSFVVVNEVYETRIIVCPTVRGD
jgi:hypothetical protein